MRRHSVPFGPIALFVLVPDSFRERRSGWLCVLCGFIYDERQGWPDEGIPAGTRWESAAAALIDVHLARGVDFRFGARISALEGDEAVSGVRLETGETLACDLVVFGVGVRPRTDLAEAAGLTVDNGVCTNQFLQTDDKRIFACGDVCRYPSVLFGRPLRLENWRNAEDQADVAARNMVGQTKTYDQVPWFWSNQYDLALQVVGLPALGQTLIMREDEASRTFLSVDCDGILRGAAALGPVKDVAPRIREARAAIAAGQRVQPTATDYPLEQSPP